MSYTNDEYKTFLKVKHELLLQDAKRNVLRYFKTDENDNSPYARISLQEFDLEKLANEFENRVDNSFSEACLWEQIIRDEIFSK